MINSVEENKIVRSGTLEEETFTIEATPEAFEILSAGLYTDAQTAVLRELGCNAYDSHVAAGNKDIPFEVKLPNAWDATLRFRDYGTGLSEEDVHNTYRKYFKSSKTESNEYTGFLGLGSKSPFSLTSSFTVCSFFNGKKSLYTVFKNERGIPTITKLAEEDTSEKNGVEISIGVPKDNMYSWTTKASAVYRWFKTKPKITPPVTFDNITTVFEGSDWKVIKESQIFAICGNVAYPIDFSLLDKKFSSRFTGLHLNIPIGSVDNTASREKLQYTQKTKTYIESKLEEIIKIACDSFEKELKSAKNFHDAQCIYLEKRSKLIEGQAKFNGLSLINSNAIDLKQFYYCSKHFNGSSLKQNRGIHYNKENKFYLNDLDRGGEQRYKDYIYKKPHSYSYLFEFATTISTAPDGTKIKKVNAGQDIKSLSTVLGVNESDIILVSSLPKIVITRTRRGKTEKILKYKGTGYGAYLWEDTTVNISDKIHYVPIFRFRVVINKKEFDSECLLSIKDFLTEHKLIPNPCDIYGVRNSFSKKARKSWINIIDLFEKNFNQYLKTDYEKLKYIDESYIGSHSFEYDTESLRNKSITNKDLATMLSEFESLKKEYKNNEKRLTYYNKCATILDVKVDVKPKIISLKDFYQKKPLLQYIPHYDWKKNDVINYINAI